MAGQLQDPVGTLGRGTSISPDLRRWLEAGTILCHLLLNRPWCQVSCKSDLFQIPSRVFSLLIQCLRYAFESWFCKFVNAPGQLSRWATTNEPECLEPVISIKRSTGLKSQCTAITEEPLLADNREVLSSNEDLVQRNIFKKFFQLR